MLKIITSVVLSLVTIMAVTLFAVTVPAQSQKIEENAAAIDMLEMKDIYIIVSANYTSGAPTFYNTEFHYYIPQNITSKDELKIYLKSHMLQLEYYVTIIENEKIINYYEVVDTGGGTTKTYKLQIDYINKPFVLFSNDRCLVGVSEQVTFNSITFYNL